MKAVGPQLPVGRQAGWHSKIAATVPLATCLVLLATMRFACAADDSAVSLPSGVQAVWDLRKAYRETTPSRERICLNGLWHWQPAEAQSEPVPAGNWGWFKVSGCWPGITDYMEKDCQTVFAHPHSAPEISLTSASPGSAFGLPACPSTLHAPASRLHPPNPKSESASPRPFPSPRWQCTRFHPSSPSRLKTPWSLAHRVFFIG